MSRHLKGNGPPPWGWGDVPLVWQDWVLVALDIHTNLSTPPEKSG